MVRMSAADAAGVDTEPDAADIIGVFGSILREGILSLFHGLRVEFHTSFHYAYGCFINIFHCYKIFHILPCFAKIVN